MRAAVALFALVLVAVAPLPAGAELPWPLGFSTGTTRITGTFGEYRDTALTNCPAPCPHFHDGVDFKTGFGSSVAGADTRLIEYGIVEEFERGTGANDYVKISSTQSARKLTYVHIVPAAIITSTGQALAYDVVIGTVINQGSASHLHLKQSTRIDSYDINLLLSPGMVNYSDLSGPKYGSIDIIDASRPGSGALSLSNPINVESVKFRAHIMDPQTTGEGSTNTGPFSVGFGIIDATQGRFVVPLAFKQQYPRLPVPDIRDPEIAFDTTTATTSTFTYFANNEVFREIPFDLSSLSDGEKQLCIISKGLEDHIVYSMSCETFTSDFTPPDKEVKRTNGVEIANGGATNETSVVVSATDTYGLQKFVLSGPTSATQPVSGQSASHTFSSLTANSTTPYVVAVHDLAGNVSSAQFTVDVGSGTSGQSSSNSASLSSSFVSTNCLVAEATKTLSGMASINVSKSGGGFSSTGTFSCPINAKHGPLCSLSAGTYIVANRDCASNEWANSLTVSTAALSLVNSGTTPHGSGSGSGTPTAAQLLGTSTFTITSNRGGGVPVQGSPCCTRLKVCMAMALSVFGVTQDGEAGCEDYCPGTGCDNQVRRRIEGSAAWWAGTTTYRVWNATVGYTADYGVQVLVELFDPVGNRVPASYSLDAAGYNLAPGEALDGAVSVSQVGQAYPTPDGVFKSSPTIKNVAVSTEAFTGDMLLAKLRRVLDKAVDAWRARGSEIVFSSTIPISFVYTDSGGVVTDTTTLKIYHWSGVDWDSSAVTGLSVSKNTGTGVITASGTVTLTGLYAAMFNGQDSSAPVTTWSIQGSSSGFQGVTMVSTYSYLVLSSTDPTVNGFASGVATTYYRIDGVPGDPFSAYTSSLSFIPGTHWVDYYATDWAGGVEPVGRATITVTAGSFTKLSGDLQVDGNLLVGFLGSGARAEVVARAEYDYALKVSSVDGRAMLAVDNANFVSVGTAPASGRLTLAGVSQDAALSLRSGNSTASVTGAQLAFGQDGQGILRHALYTQHGSAAYNNKMVFSLWTPSAGSSSTLGNLPVLSLEGSTVTVSSAVVHIRPTSETATEELVVSNGVTFGGGAVLRWDAVQPSARALKTDIERLGAEDERRAYDEVATLQPSRYRRKLRLRNGSLVEDPSAPLERGYLYEEAPASIRAPHGGLIVDERLVNAEMALKAAIRHVEELEARIKRIKESRRSPR